MMNFCSGVYAKNFHDEGFEVLAARDGQEAWEIISAGNIPDVVFTGIVMPRMTGFELIAKMQADPKLAEIPTAINSHRGRPEDQQLAEKMNVDDFIIQGTTTPVEVVRRIELLLGLQKSFRIAILSDSYDGVALINYLNKQQNTNLEADKEGRAHIKLQASETEKNVFKVEIVSDEEFK
ncbi:response regulator [Candidatus Wolfebacteria bacterium]|nr:response regulator [Candidatus Wolfebacteria bacterium]